MSGNKAGGFFNIPAEEDLRIPARRTYCLIIYDISSTKRRNRLVKLLKGFGERVQESCFEALLTAAKLKTLHERVGKFYSETEHDNIRIYRFRGEGDVTIFGDAALPENEESVFI